MKTRELIARLQEADPEGNTECCVGNEDIFFVDGMPAYYDGRLQVLIRDESKSPFYNVVGAKVTSKGAKIKIVTHSIEDAISENPELPVDTSEIGNDQYRKEYEAVIARWREEAVAMKKEVARFAAEYAKTKAAAEKG
jgi:hypothetical protein